jgi:quercetin dioxygenase-like cupin family protein
VKRPRLHELAPGMLLVFKPRHHLERRHAHDYKQKIRLLRGKLELRLGGRRRLLGGGAPVATIPAGRPHRTRALEDTWLIVERIE